MAHMKNGLGRKWSSRYDILTPSHEGGFSRLQKPLSKLTVWQLLIGFFDEIRVKSYQTDLDKTATPYSLFFTNDDRLDGNP